MSKRDVEMHEPLDEVIRAVLRRHGALTPDDLVRRVQERLPEEDERAIGAVVAALINAGDLVLTEDADFEMAESDEPEPAVANR